MGEARAAQAERAEPGVRAAEPGEQAARSQVEQEEPVAAQAERAEPGVQQALRELREEPAEQEAR